jgi:hypothetical protein
VPGREGWQGLFSAAFNQSRNPMLLLDERRRQLDAGGREARRGPPATP